MVFNRIARLLMLLFMVCVSAQQQVVPLSVNGNNFEISLRSSDSPQDTAAIFCRENASLLGITDLAIPNCIKSVSDYLLRFISTNPFPNIESLPQSSQSSSEKSAQSEAVENIIVTLNVNDAQYEISLRPDISSVSNAATVFCRDHSSKLGIVDNLMGNCIEPVSQYLKTTIERRNSNLTDSSSAVTTPSIDSSEKEKLLKVDLRMAGNTYEVRFRPDRINDMAISFCEKQGRVAGVTDETMPSCIDSIAKYLQQVANDSLAQQLVDKRKDREELTSLKVTLNIAGKNYEILYQPDVVPAANTATTFCKENMIAFGITESTLPSSCVEPVAKYLLQAFQSSLLEKRKANEAASATTATALPASSSVTSDPLKVTLNVAGKDYDIVYQPEVQSVTVVATKFCRDNMIAFGVTDATLSTSCAGPVANYLTQAYNANKNKNGEYDASSTTQTTTDTTASTSTTSNKAVEAAAVATNEQPLATSSTVDQIKVTLNIAGKNYEILYQPDVVPAATTATTFCKENMIAFGITESTLPSSCVEPVAKYLLQATKK